MKSHADKLNKDLLLIQTLKDDQEALCRRMARQLTAIQRDTLKMVESLHEEVKDLKAAISQQSAAELEAEGQRNALLNEELQKKSSKSVELLKIRLRSSLTHLEPRRICIT